MIQEQQKTNCDRVTNDARTNLFRLFLKGECHMKGLKLGWLMRWPFFLSYVSFIWKWSSQLFVAESQLTHLGYSSVTCPHTQLQAHACTHTEWVRSTRAAVCNNEAGDQLCTVSALRGMRVFPKSFEFIWRIRLFESPWKTLWEGKQSLEGHGENVCLYIQADQSDFLQLVKLACSNLDFLLENFSCKSVHHGYPSCTEVFNRTLAKTSWK